MKTCPMQLGLVALTPRNRVEYSLTASSSLRTFLLRFTLEWRAVIHLFPRSPKSLRASRNSPNGEPLCRLSTRLYELEK